MSLTSNLLQGFFSSLSPPNTCSNLGKLTVLQPDGANAQESILDKAAATATNTTPTNNKQGEDIMSVLLAHEKKGGSTNPVASIKATLPQESSDSSDNEEDAEMQAIDTGMRNILIKLHAHSSIKSNVEQYRKKKGKTAR